MRSLLSRGAGGSSQAAQDPFRNWEKELWLRTVTAGELAQNRPVFPPMPQEKT